MGKVEKIHRAWLDFRDSLNKLLIETTLDMSKSGASTLGGLERDRERIILFLKDVDLAINHIEAENLTRASEVLSSLHVLFRQRTERLYAISEVQFAVLRSSYERATEIMENPNRNLPKSKKRREPIQKPQLLDCAKYDKVELIETLKKAHQFYIEQLEKELYVEYSHRPEFMLEEAYQKYKEILEKRMLEAKSSYDRILPLMPFNFDKSQAAELTALIKVTYSNRMQSEIFLLVPETSISAASLEKFSFPVGLSWNSYFGKKIGDRIEMFSEGRGESFQYFAEIVDII